MNYAEQKTEQLKTECRARGIHASARKPGSKHCNWLSKPELISRLEAWDAEHGTAPAITAAPVAAAKTATPVAPAPVAPSTPNAANPAPAPKAPAPVEPEAAEKTETRRESKESAAPNAAEPPRATKGGAKLAKDWTAFLSDFQHRPQARFLNSIARLETVEAIREYVSGYFALSGSEYANDVPAKLESAEAAELMERTVKATPNVKINTRLAIYYGEPGGGKTTEAIRENPGAEIVVCDSAMTPDELFRGFTFEDGKPVFKGSALRRAMESGRTVILDEINLLTSDCLRALQTITDRKTEVVIGTEEITIKPGFRVLGTMNLEVNGQICSLPTPLVDRAGVIRHFEATPEAAAAFAGL